MIIKSRRRIYLYFYWRILMALLDVYFLGWVVVEVVYIGGFFKNDFYNFVILKEVTENKYLGYNESEKFRYIPACIRYRVGTKLSARALVIMAPLYRRGEIKFKWRYSEEIIKQLESCGNQINFFFVFFSYFFC